MGDLIIHYPIEKEPEEKESLSNEIQNDQANLSVEINAKNINKFTSIEPLTKITIIENLTNQGYKQPKDIILNKKYFIIDLHNHLNILGIISADLALEKEVISTIRNKSL